jgi:hypothetical protein
MKTRENKKRLKKQRLEQSRLLEKRRLEDVLSALGLLEGFRDLPGATRQAVIRSLPGRPKLAISPNDRPSPAVAGLKGQIEMALAGATMWTEDGKPVPLLDFLSVCCALQGGFASLASAPLARKHRDFAGHAAKVSGAFFEERVGAAVDWLGTEVMMYLLVHSRMDGQVLGCLLEELTVQPGKPVCRLVLHSSQPRSVHVEIDGKPRLAYQCAAPWRLEGIRWVDCDGAALGLEGGRQYPVFLQSHALRRLRERLASSLIPEVAVHLGLMCSVAELTVVERQGDRYLIAFHVRGTRVGYLPARLVQDRLVITSFLLLTMEGTPEGRRLREKLRLTRRDIEYGGLDRLETFLTPDVLGDRDLVRVLEECGCGSLLTLAREGFPHTAVVGHAEELKRFLGITDGRDQELSKRLCSPQPRVA